MKKKLRTVTALLLIISILSACGASSSLTETPDTQKQTDTSEEPVQPFADGRPMLIKASEQNNFESVTPCSVKYTINPDLSNIYNLKQFYLDERYLDKLAQNGFIVGSGYGNEFYEVYEDNMDMGIPNFVTVDSLMHTYHLYFSLLLRNIEKDYIADSLTQLSARMLDISISQYNTLKGSEWENAALKNVAFLP